ncbi:hypothetical protein EDB87DRAFT_1579785 [Lactarius vividus]|nr:hypothetical protein EDB87DRAFT_1579785 [Lactarius vividus]
MCPTCAQKVKGEVGEKGVPAALRCLFGPLPVTAAGQGRAHSSSAKATVASGTNTLPFHSTCRRFRAREGLETTIGARLPLRISENRPDKQRRVDWIVRARSSGVGTTPGATCHPPEEGVHPHPAPPTATSTTWTENPSGAWPGCSSSVQRITVRSTWPAGSTSGDRDEYHQIRYKGKTAVRMQKQETLEGQVDSGRARSCLGVLAPIYALRKERDERLGSSVLCLVGYLPKIPSCKEIKPRPDVDKTYHTSYGRCARFEVRVNVLKFSPTTPAQVPRHREFHQEEGATRRSLKNRP